jgi:hypothetical protein
MGKNVYYSVERRWVSVSFTKEGIHAFPEAATDKNLATGDKYDVSFLASPHRHIFHYSVLLEVEHNNREIEFIQLKRWLLDQFNRGVLKADNKSCEMLAEDIYVVLQKHKHYKNRTAIIKVFEDEENGAILEIIPEIAC